MIKTLKTLLTSTTILTFLLLTSCQDETINIEETSTTITEQESLKKELTKISYNGNNIEVQQLDNFYLWGDILIPMSVVNNDDSSTQRSSIVADNDLLWPNNTVTYYFDPNFGNTTKADVAVHHWELFTTLNFVEATNPADDDLIIFKGQGCNATVGYRDGSHENSVSIGDNCDIDDAIHEFGHVVGLFHEQNRNDRDEYIEVFFDNIFPSAHTQFIKNEDKGNQSLEFTPFDFQSTMLYSSNLFSIEGINNSMLKLNGESFPRFPLLSKYDIIGIESLYREGSPKKVAISSLINGKYVSSENGRQNITINRSSIGSWETFTVHPIGEGVLALQASNGKFLSIDEVGNLAFNSKNVGSDEKFTVLYGDFTNRDKIYYTLSHKDFDTMFVDDVSNEIKIDGSGGGGQDSLFAIEILK